MTGNTEEQRKMCVEELEYFISLLDAHLAEGEDTKLKLKDIREEIIEKIKKGSGAGFVITQILKVLGIIFFRGPAMYTLDRKEEYTEEELLQSPAYREITSRLKKCDAFLNIFYQERSDFHAVKETISRDDDAARKCYEIFYRYGNKQIDKERDGRCFYTELLEACGMSIAQLDEYLSVYGTAMSADYVECAHQKFGE